MSVATFHAKFICDDEIDVAVNPVTCDGGVVSVVPVTVNVNDVVLATLPVPVTVIVDVPVGVVEPVLIVNVVVQVGLQDVVENIADAPVGNP